MRRFALPSATLAATLVALLGAVAIALPRAEAQLRTPDFADTATAREALERARLQARNARARGEAFERQERRGTAAADKAQARAAALAARVQQAEAAIGIAEAESALIAEQRRRLDRRLAVERGPIAELAAALQTMVRRPTTLAILRPGSLRETVYLGAVLDSTVPLIRARTADLRDEIVRARQLQEASRKALADRRVAERRLTARRAELVALSQRERLTARRAGGAANREEVRALTLAEEARDIDSLLGDLEAAATLRQQLAALPGPVMRSRDPSAQIASSAAAPVPVPSSTAPPARYRLPVEGRIEAGFGETERSGGRTGGLALATRPGAQVVATAPGRIGFAGPYRGYGRIVIIEHANGWTSLVTGLAELDARVGQDVVGGSPLGRAPRDGPRIGLELRRGGDPVNPLDYISRNSSNGA
ncbi:murein hydrolase activator EnvC family protein [Qipengyuania spongiae]|uniref:Peptidoglycan DD-metalloendopeptidase family protein n=1 Tax=Qipengyuania spongiae TaxID=2909673 RepID=A0ABY5T3X8_9SPHN|nr:peptidoglycan DD-metalloendopeptidase family protein [Qipengyuania spongiae]UVI40038.1 peptidoglycan DD-metalloendopeptidase family protein [Qipengyuania spongiae]